MTGTIAGLCALAFLLGAEDLKETLVKAEKAKLQGNWMSESVVSAGKLKLWTEVVIEGDRLEWHIKASKGQRSDDRIVWYFRYTLDPTKKPKQIDLVRTQVSLISEIPDTGQRGGLSQGIYRLDGQTLVLCYAASRQERPRSFESQKGSRLLTLKRQKP